MRSLSRKKAHRKSLLRNLATSLVLYERIKTTVAKAKEVKPLVEHLINFAQKNASKKPLAARRRLQSFFFDENATKKVLEELAPRYQEKKSGFIKIYKLGPRIGDKAEICLLELEKIKVQPEEGQDAKRAKKESKPKDENRKSKKAAKTKDTAAK